MPKGFSPAIGRKRMDKRFPPVPVGGTVPLSPEEMLDDGAREIIARLNAGGYEAYAVGGCVRDRLLGKIPDDYDVATSATPEQTREIFSERYSLPTGLKHGTVTVLVRGKGYEVTSFRTEGEYEDGRRPSSVFFVRDLKEDLRRRDFTVNALAYHPNEGIIDLYEGLSDLKNGIVRAVGEPERRFSEDALRILRAVRFSSVLRFRVEEKTASAAIRMAERLDLVSAERKSVELKKLLLGEGARSALLDFAGVIVRVVPELAPCVGFEQNSRWHRYDVYEHIARSVEACPKDTVLRLTMLLHDVGKPSRYSEKDGQGHFYGHEAVSARLAKNALERLKIDNKTKNTVVKLISLHGRPFPVKEYKLKKLLAETGREDALRLLDVAFADNAAQGTEPAAREREKIDAAKERILGLLRSGEPYEISMLKVSGEDLSVLGFRGKEIGEELCRLLDACMRGELKNERETLLARAAERGGERRS